MPFQPDQQNTFTPDAPVDTFIQETNEVVKAPSSFSADAVTYLNNVQNKFDDSVNYMGFTRVGQDHVKEAAKGLSNFVTTVPATVAGAESVRLGESIKSIVTGVDRTKPKSLASITTDTFLSVLGIPPQLKDSIIDLIPSQIGEETKQDLLAVSDQMISAGNDLVLSNRKWVKEHGFEKSEDTSEGVAFDLGSAFGSVGASIGVSLLTRSPSMAAVMFGELSRSSAYIEAKEKGFPPESAAALSDLMGSAEGALEAMGVSYFLKAASKHKGLGLVLMRTAEEALQEGFQQVAEETISQVSGLRELDIEGALGRVLYSMALGGVAGGTVSTSIEIGKSVRRKEDKISDQDITKLAQAIENNSEEISTELSSIVMDESSDINKDEQAQKQVANMLRQFNSGTPINTDGLSDSDKRIVADATAVQQQLDQINMIEPHVDSAPPIKERIEFLNKDIVSVERDIKSLAQQINQFIENDRPIKRLNEKIDAALEKKKRLISEIENLKNEGLIKTLGPDVLSGMKIVTRQSAIDRAALDESRKSIKEIKIAFKQGVSAAKKDVKSVQGAVITALNSSGLNAADKAKFISAIKNIQTPQQLEVQAPKLIDRIESLLNAESNRSQKAALSKELSFKSIKTNIVGGKKVGRFGADVQDKLEDLRDLNSLNKEDATRALDESLAGETFDPLTNRILTIRSGEASPAFVEQTIEDIQSLKQFGIQGRDQKFLASKANVMDTIDDISAFINRNGDVVTKKRDKLPLMIVKGIKGAASDIVDRIALSWSDVVDVVAPAKVLEHLDVTAEIEARKRIMRVMQDKLVAAAVESYSLKGDKQAVKMLDDSGISVDLGVFVDMSGKKVRLEFSRAEARKLWMEYRDAQLVLQTLRNEKGNAYTQDMESAIFGLLSPEDIHFANAQLDIYSEFYDSINDVYSDVFGANLPKVEFYSPIRREIDKDDPNKGQFLQETSFRRPLAAGTALKLRNQDANAALKTRSDIAVFNSHIAEMAHFIAFRKKTMFLDAVFGDRTLRAEIKKGLGKNFMDLLDDRLMAVSVSGIRAGNALDKFVNLLNRNFSAKVLGLKAKIGITQLSSYFAFAEGIPSTALVSGTRDFFANHKKAIEILGATDFMKNRGASLDVDIARMGKTFDSKFLRSVQKKKDRLIDYTLVFTKMGDRAAIYTGGWAVYKYNIDQGKTHDQAILAFIKAASQTQQSSDPDKLSALQGGSAIERALVMFMSAPMAQYRGEMRALRGFLSKKEISKRDFAKRMVIYHFLIPQVFQALSNAIMFGEFDEEDQMRAAVLGSLNGVPLIGTAVTEAFRAVQGKGNFGQDTFKWMSDFRGEIEDAMDALTGGEDGDFDDFVDIMASMGLQGAGLAGVPTPQIKKIIEGTEDLQEGDTRSATMRFLGFPDSVIDGDKKSKGKKLF